MKKNNILFYIKIMLNSKNKKKNIYYNNFSNFNYSMDHHFH